jgi:hypothetical protein
VAAHFILKVIKKKPEKPDSEGEEDGLRVVKTKIFVKNFGITGGVFGRNY